MVDLTPIMGQCRCIAKCAWLGHGEAAATVQSLGFVRQRTLQHAERLGSVGGMRRAFAIGGELWEPERPPQVVQFASHYRARQVLYSIKAVEEKQIRAVPFEHLVRPPDFE
jgi:hypothetical protein